MSGRVVIEYVDGTQQAADVSEWADLRGDGVNAVGVQGARAQGQSVYWLRRDAEGRLRFGGASFYEQKPFEVICVDEGQWIEAQIDDDHVPDLRHDEVKLGWWWTRG